MSLLDIMNSDDYSKFKDLNPSDLYDPDTLQEVIDHVYQMAPPTSVASDIWYRKNPHPETDENGNFYGVYLSDMVDRSKSNFTRYIQTELLGADFPFGFDSMQPNPELFRLIKLEHAKQEIHGEQIGLHWTGDPKIFLDRDFYDYMMFINPTDISNYPESMYVFKGVLNSPNEISAYLTVRARFSFPNEREFTLKSPFRGAFKSLDVYRVSDIDLNGRLNSWKSLKSF